MSLLNRHKVKQYILERANDLRFHEFSQVSEESLNVLEHILVRKIDYLISIHPSVGKRIVLEDSGK